MSLLPLPPGEGWGEGAVSAVSPCRGLVAQHLRRLSVWPRENITLTPNPSPGGRGENKVLVLDSRLVLWLQTFAGPDVQPGHGEERNGDGHEDQVGHGSVMLPQHRPCHDPRQAVGLRCARNQGKGIASRNGRGTRGCRMQTWRYQPTLTCLNAWLLRIYIVHNSWRSVC